MQVIVGPFIEALDAFINKVGIQLLDCSLTGKGSAYTGSQLSCPTLTHIFGVGATTGKV